MVCADGSGGEPAAPVAGRMRNRRRLARRPTEAQQTSAAGCSNAGRVAQPLPKTCVSTRLIIVKLFLEWSVN